MTGPNEVTEYKVRVGCDRLDEWRIGVCSLRCQDETAEIALQNTVDRTRRVKTVLRNTPRYSHDTLVHCECEETDTLNATATGVLHGRLHNAQSKLRKKRHSSSGGARTTTVKS